VFEQKTIFFPKVPTALSHALSTQFFEVKVRSENIYVYNKWRVFDTYSIPSEIQDSTSHLKHVQTPHKFNQVNFSLIEHAATAF